jgi:hypothetical protein
MRLKIKRVIYEDTNLDEAGLTPTASGQAGTWIDCS